MNTDEHRSPLLRLGCSVLLTRESFPGRKGFFFAKSSRLRGESWAGLSSRRREAREENAKDFSLVAAMPRCVHLWFHPYCGPVSWRKTSRYTRSSLWKTDDEKAVSSGALTHFGSDRKSLGTSGVGFKRLKCARMGHRVRR